MNQINRVQQSTSHDGISLLRVDDKAYGFFLGHPLLSIPFTHPAWGRGATLQRLNVRNFCLQPSVSGGLGPTNSHVCELGSRTPTPAESQLMWPQLTLGLSSPVRPSWDRAIWWSLILYPQELWKNKCVCCSDLLSFGVIFYIAIDDWHRRLHLIANIRLKIK